MTVPIVLVVVFTACALGLAAFSLWVSWGARRDARQALNGVRALAASRGRKRAPEAPDEDRVVDLGPPPEVDDRRRHDDGPAGRHRPREERYSRLRASADTREAHEQPADDPTTAIPVVRPGDELPETAEHPAPTGRFRQPPPPLPRPGSIGRPQ